MLVGAEATLMAELDVDVDVCPIRPTSVLWVTDLATVMAMPLHLRC